MVSHPRVALTPTDRLLGGYLAFVTAVIIARGVLPGTAAGWMLAFHTLFAVLLYLFTRLAPDDTVGNGLHILYPLFLTLPFYGEFGLINGARPAELLRAHDAVVQGWEAAVFGRQVSYDWIRRWPSVFWSTVFHAAYFAFYVTVVLGPVILLARGRGGAARDVLFRTMTAFVPCYVTFVLYPVAGPYYAFPHPTGPVRDVWSAQLVYDTLASGSSIGAAFPSSHVAASVAATLAVGRWSRPLFAIFLPLTLLLVVGTVYCQMHYGVDALAGMLVGVAAWWVAGRFSGGGAPPAGGDPPAFSLHLPDPAG